MDATKAIAFKDLFLLDPEVVFLNHGSFGATPKPVFEVYQDWQKRLEKQPVKFLGREVTGYLREARASLGKYLNVSSNDLVYVPNATFGVNVVARSLNLSEGDEVLTCDQEYGACNNTWTYLSQQRGFTYKKQAIPLPVSSSQEILDTFWQGVTPQTKVIYLSHITSPTALTLPISKICAKARKEGILTVIDGAHAPGQLELNLTEIDADFYTGNCHKWLCSPKGAAFLYTRKDKQDLIEPLVLSWGWNKEAKYSAGSTYLDRYDWLGTHDPAAYLSVPAAIDFQAEHDWPAVRERCHTLLQGALESIEALTGLPTLYPTDSDLYRQLAVAALPAIEDTDAFKTELYDDYRIEIPLTHYNDEPFVRISVQAYNTAADVDALLRALEKMLA